MILNKYMTSVTDSLDKKILGADCPAMNRILGIFGRRCGYTGNRCLHPIDKPIFDCYDWRSNYYGKSYKRRTENIEGHNPT